MTMKPRPAVFDVGPNSSGRHQAPQGCSSFLSASGLSLAVSQAVTLFDHAHSAGELTTAALDTASTCPVVLSRTDMRIMPGSFICPRQVGCQT